MKTEIKKNRQKDTIQAQNTERQEERTNATKQEIHNER